jgi:hypothetical protein
LHSAYLLIMMNSEESWHEWKKYFVCVCVEDECVTSKTEVSMDASMESVHGHCLDPWGKYLPQGKCFAPPICP